LIAYDKDGVLPDLAPSLSASRQLKDNGATRLVCQPR
jgi:hypothetical protein